MKKVFTVFLFIHLSVHISFSQVDLDPIQPPIKSITHQDMMQWVDSITSFWMDSVEIPGMVISIVADDSILVQKGYGYINQEMTQKVDASSSPFRIASISKTFTSLANMQLVSDGKLDLHTDVSEYLDFDINRYKASEITLHHLLTHSAGLDEKLLGGGTKDKSEVPNLEEYLLSSMPGQIRTPGVAFSYSNMGYTLAGYLGEIASGQPFHEYVNETILQPLDMNNTTYWRGDDPVYADSKSYFLDDKGFREYPPYELKSYPSGSMISTASDMSNYMIMLLNKGQFEGKHVVDSNVIELLTKEVFTQDDRLTGSRSYGFFNWDINGVNYMNHGGSIEGYRSLLYIYPELKIGMFIATNSSWGSRSNSEIGRAFRKDWLEITELPIDTALSHGIPEKASEITGSYFTTRSPFTSIMRIGRLTNWTLDVRFNEEGYMYIAGNPGVLYAETAPLEYTIGSQNRDAANKIIFKENQEGGIAYMFTSGTNSYFRLKWWETTKVQLIYALTIFVVFLTFLSYNLVKLFRNKFPFDSGKPQFHYRSSVIATLFHLITFFTIGFYLYISDGLVFDFGLPWFLKVLMALPIIAVILTIISVMGLKPIINDSNISRIRKGIFISNLIALVLIIPFLYYWNMLGFNY